MILMHAENGPVIDIVAAEQVAAGNTDPSATASRATRSSRARRPTG